MYTLQTFSSEVSKIMQEMYGISWEDAHGGMAPLEAAMEHETPREFVERYGEKHDLTPISSLGY